MADEQEVTWGDGFWLLDGEPMDEDFDICQLCGQYKVCVFGHDADACSEAQDADWAGYKEFLLEQREFEEEQEYLRMSDHLRRNT